MKINCGPSAQAKRATKQKYIEELYRKPKKQWHDWFAWLPTRVGENDCRWLETIQRKYAVIKYNDFHYDKSDFPQYRAKSGS